MLAASTVLQAQNATTGCQRLPCTTRLAGTSHLQVIQVRTSQQQRRQSISILHAAHAGLVQRRQAKGPFVLTRVCPELKQLLRQLDLVRCSSVVQRVPALLVAVVVQVEPINASQLLSSGLLQEQENSFQSRCCRRWQAERRGAQPCSMQPLRGLCCLMQATSSAVASCRTVRFSEGVAGDQQAAC